MTTDRRALIAGVTLLLGLSLYLSLRIDVATDIAHFLPSGKQTEEVILANEMVGSELSRTMILLIDAPDQDTAILASQKFEQELRKDPVVTEGTTRLVGGTADGFEDAIWKTYEPHRCALLADNREQALKQLTDDALQRSARELKDKLATPMSTFLARIAPTDPLLILPNLFERLMSQRKGGLKLVNERFLTEKEDGAVLFLTTKASTSNATALRPLVAAIESAFRRVNDQFQHRLKLQQSGTHVYALAAEANIKRDIQRVSIGSLIGLTSLFLVMFRSLRLMLLVLPILSAGFLAGSCACIWMFGSVHGLTLAFGAALIGVSVDYGVHFHCHHLFAGANDQPRQSLRKIWPGLALGAITTTSGFLALMASGFPGLRQLAVFAVFGIATAALATQLFLPALAGTHGKTTAASRRTISFLRNAWFSPHRSRVALSIPIAITVVITVVGLPQLTWNDAFSSLNRIDPEVEALDKAIRNRVAHFEQRRLIVATGRDEEEALQVNDAINTRLKTLQSSGAIGGYRSIANMLKSAQTQRAVDATVRSDKTLWPRLSSAYTDQGFVDVAFHPWREFLSQPSPKPLTFADLAKTPLSTMVEPFHFTWSRGVGFASFLQDLHDEPAVRHALADLSGASLVDITGTLSNAYGNYRQRLLQLWLIGLGAVFLIVAARHRATRPTLIAYTPAVLAAAGTAGVLSLAGIELNMLSLVALLMVVSMGVDYGVFLAEHRQNPRARDATLLAILLAGSSTMLGFGLLAMSSQPPLFHIGITAFVGILFCMILAPTVCALLPHSGDGGDQRASQAQQQDNH